MAKQSRIVYDIGHPFSCWQSHHYKIYFGSNLGWTKAVLRWPRLTLWSLLVWHCHCYQPAALYPPPPPPQLLNPTALLVVHWPQRGRDLIQTLRSFCLALTFPASFFFVSDPIAPFMPCITHLIHNHLHFLLCPSSCLSNPLSLSPSLLDCWSALSQLVHLGGRLQTVCTWLPLNG